MLNGFDTVSAVLLTSPIKLVVPRDETYSGDSSGDESVAEADESADHLLAVRPPKRKGNRLVVMSWSMLKEGDRDRRDVLKRKSSSAPSAGMSRKSSMDRSE